MADPVELQPWEDPMVQVQFARVYAEMALAGLTALINLTPDRVVRDVVLNAMQVALIDYGNGPSAFSGQMKMEAIRRMVEGGR